MSMGSKFALPEFKYEAEIGKFAKQADGAVWFKQGGTVVLATVVSAEAKEFPGFFPLMVDYREYFSAAGKIPGGYFKREGRMTDREILTARLIDRAIRPLFPEDYFNQVQIQVTVYSVDKQHSPRIPAMIAASAALSVSPVPFMGPIGSIEVARVDGAWKVSPTYLEAKDSDVNVVVAGTGEGICMVEGCTNEITEKELIDILFLAHDNVKKQVSWQEEIQKSAGAPKQAAVADYGWDLWRNEARNFLSTDRLDSLFIADKLERDDLLNAMTDEFMQAQEERMAADGVDSSVVSYAFNQELKKGLTDRIFNNGKRIDGRDFESVRAISTEIDVLPFVHGSALFTRGRTQALVTLTLGSGDDEQRIESLMGDTVDSSFMLHYNFPSFSVGEVRPSRGPGRREVGHGNLAASAFKYMLPEKEAFPYTIRLVSDILESDGSSSMATVCGSTMALMDGGVPVKKMVSGVAMGLLHSSDGQFQALTDISGFEDAFGLMDFKVAGTDKGITAIQMDIKYKGGLPREVFEKALAQADRGREHIRNEMAKVMAEPNQEVADTVPRFTTFKVSTDRIGQIIGSGGKVIREIIERTGTNIDIEDDGTVKVFGSPGEKMDLAVTWCKILGGVVEPGIVVEGKIKRLAEFGMFVEVAPGKDGLVHISAIPKDQQRGLAQHYPVGDMLRVVITDYDKETERIRLKIKGK